jgi:hypothetical protein
MTSSTVTLSVFALALSVVATVALVAGAMFYFRRVRMDRPAIGAFNRRDVVVLFVLLATLPLLYVRLPRELLTSFLTLTFVSALSIGLRPVLSATRMWVVIGLLIGGNIWLGNNMLGTVFGWQLFWAENSVIVLLAAISVANLYVQGGMKLKHVAWFALALTVYDVVFTSFYPVTNALVEEFLGYPLDPSVGMRWGFDNAAIGLGDLLVYGLFALAAFKAYGKPGARFALGLVVVFGAVVPSLIPLIINYVDARTDTLVPAQAWFGPAAALGCLWLRHRYGAERTTAEFLASDDALARRPLPTQSPAATPARTDQLVH